MSILNTTRRSALAALAGATLVPLPGKAAKKATAFGLIGDRYHNSDYIRIGLTRTIAKELGVTIECPVAFDYVQFSGTAATVST